jgi:nitrite reductase (NO-forming)
MPPADVSHGEAPIGRPVVAGPPMPVDLPPLAEGKTRGVQLEVLDAEVVIDKDVAYAAWTFGGTVPGPILHVRQGDTVNFTLTNRGTMAHSMDFHAAELAPDKHYRNIDPGQSIHYTFEARVPGAFLYHCGTAPVAMHNANGMYGALIVDPPTPRPAAHELVLVQSEF